MTIAPNYIKKNTIKKHAKKINYKNQNLKFNKIINLKKFVTILFFLLLHKITRSG